MWHALDLLIFGPFRLLGRLIDQCGRLASLVLGFSAMVLGTALAANVGLLLWAGGALFLFGLWLTLRALG